MEQLTQWSDEVAVPGADALAEYYAKRASEYDTIYGRPERQSDLRRLESVVGQSFAGWDVLEIACGTGYWTRFIAQRASSIVAIDCNRQVLEVARQRAYGECPVTFVETDAYTLSEVSGRFDAAFCGFWWSHVPRRRLPAFLGLLHSRLRNGALIIAIDNIYVEGSSTPIAGRDCNGETYQIRMLQDGTRHEVLKNFPSEAELRSSLGEAAIRVEYSALEYYWLLRYKVGGSRRT